MHTVSYFQVICLCGREHHTEKTELICNCGRQLVIEWREPAKADQAKKTAGGPVLVKRSAA